MTREELSVFLQDWFCGCGTPEEAAESLRRLLALHPLYTPEAQAELAKMVPDTGIRYLVLYTLDRFELNEHGGNVGGSWLTTKGKSVLAALNREKADEYEALFVMRCSHGLKIDEDCGQCRALLAERQP